MRKIVLPIVLLAALSSSYALAGTKPSNPTKNTSSPVLTASTPTPSVTDGTISAIDDAACTVSLGNAHVYQFAPGCDLKPYRVGEKVAITWTASGGGYNASLIAAA